MRLFEQCVRVTRAAWNWLVAMDRPVFDARRRNYAMAMEQAKAQLPGEKDGSKKLHELAATLCREMEKANPLPPFPSKAVLGKPGEAKAFEDAIAPDDEGLRAALEAVKRGECKTVLREVFDRYKNAREGALGFTSGKRRKGRAGVPSKERKALQAEHASGRRRKGRAAGAPRFRSRADTDIHASIAWQVQAKTAWQKQDGSWTWTRPTEKLGQWRYLTVHQGRLCRRGAIRLKGDFGWVRFRDGGRRLTEALQAGATTNMVRIVRERNAWYVAFDVTYTVSDPETKPGAIGLDRGVAVPVATSEGLLDPALNGTAMLRKIRRLERRKAHLQRVAARRLRAAARAADALTETGGFKRGVRIPKSNRFLRAKAQVAAVSDKISRIRGEWHAQLACYVADRYGMVVIEDLATQRMTRSAKGTQDAPGRNVAAKAGLNRSILAVGWSALASRLEHALTRRGGILEKVDPAYTSQTCHACGAVDAESRKGQVFRCVHCGHEDHADVNAAKNILVRGVGGRNPEPAGESQPMRVDCASEHVLDARCEARSPGIASALVVCKTPGSARKAQAVDYSGLSTSSVRSSSVKTMKPKATGPEHSQTPSQMPLFPGLQPGAVAKPG